MKRVILVVALAAALAGCTSSSQPAADPTPSPPSPTTSADPTTRAIPPKLTPSGDAPVQGLDVEYVDADGHVKTLRVKDFPR